MFGRVYRGGQNKRRGARRDLDQRGRDQKLFGLRSAQRRQRSGSRALYEKAVSIYDIDSLSKRIAEAQAQLNAINASLAEYDSLVTLSTVTLNIYQDTAPPPSDPVDDSFGATLLRVLKGAGTAIAVFFEYLLYAVIYVGPFAIVGLGIAFPVWYQTTKKKRMAAKAAKKEAKEIVETKDADEK